MKPGEAVTPLSPLEKPLHLLTEHDISQLTREDCRRYLKLKGPFFFSPLFLFVVNV